MQILQIVFLQVFSLVKNQDNRTLTKGIEKLRDMPKLRVSFLHTQFELKMPSVLWGMLCGIFYERAMFSRFQGGQRNCRIVETFLLSSSSRRTLKGKQNVSSIQLISIILKTKAISAVIIWRRFSILPNSSHNYAENKATSFRTLPLDYTSIMRYNMD